MSYPLRTVDRVEKILDAVERVRRAEKGCDDSLAAFPLDGKLHDSEHGKAHWSLVSSEKTAALTELIYLCTFEKPGPSDVTHCRLCSQLVSVPEQQ